MRLKSNVKFGSSELAMSFAISVVNSVFIKHGYEFVITSVNDSQHMKGSLHYQNKAFDCRTKHLPDEQTKLAILADIKEGLTEDFDVLYEKPDDLGQHLHIEYDKK